MSKNDPAGLAHAKKLIKENLETQATFLDLGNCGLRDLSELPELWECQHLEGLNIGTWHHDNEFEIIFNKSYGVNQIGLTGIITLSENLNQMSSLDLKSNGIRYLKKGNIFQKFENLTHLNLSDNQIGKEGIRDITENLLFLESLNLSHNNLDAIDIESISKSLKELLIIDFSSNRIGDKGAHFIAKNLSGLNELSLSSAEIGREGIKMISENISKLVKLNLSSNNLGSIAAVLISENLNELTSLNLSSNNLQVVGTKTIVTKCQNLISLNLASNQIGGEGLAATCNNQKQLLSLNLSSNQISTLGIKLISENLKNLTTLILRRNEINDEGAGFISKNLIHLEKLDLAWNKISDKGTTLISQNLKQLLFLDLNRNQITDQGVNNICKYSRQLIYLNLRSNRIGHLGLKLLSINLNKLKFLDLSSNLIKDISFLIPLLSKDSISIKFDKDVIEIPPKEIIELGVEAIVDYFRQIAKVGLKALLEAKMVLLGDGRAGKTSLANRLLKKELPKEEDRTKGVDIMIGGYPFPVEEGEFTLNIWDFAGQDKYKPLHQFFYSESSLYVMVADSGNAQTDFSDWFESANLYGEGSPLLVVLNEFCEGIGYGTFAEDQWKGQFPSLIKEVHLVNLLKQKDISLLERDIRHYARQLPHVQYEFPTNWADIRAELERRRDENFISFQEYLRICIENNLPERNSALILSSVLHKIGVCLHYQKSEILSQHIILKNEWATTAVYKILEDHAISEVKKGFFDVEDLHRIWSDSEYQDMIPQLLELMREFKLAYPLPVNNEYVAPPLLPQAQPRDIEITETNATQVMVEFEFLPKALMTQFIVSRHKDIDQNRTMVWRDGVVLCWPPNTRSIIRKIKSRGRNAFQILVNGPEQRGLLTSIIKTLRDLCDEYKGIRIQEIVKCTCEGCQSGKNEQHFFDFKNLTHRLEKGRRTVECDKSLEEVDLLKLLGSLFIFEQMRIGQKVELKDVKKEIQIVKIFLASSSELAVDRDNFDLYFRQQNDILPDEKGIYLKIVRWENFLDAMSETRLQDEYNKEVKACDIFVSLFFTKTGKFTEEEFDVAHQQFKESGGVRPQIFTFFKNADIKTGSITEEIRTLLDFKDKLSSLAHYHTQYENLADLKLQFRDQLDRLVREGKI